MYKKIISCILVLYLAVYGISLSVSGEEKLEVSAPSALLMEQETGRVIFAKNAHEKRACASVTKIMTLCLIFEALESGKISYDSIVTASPFAAAAGGSDIWLVEGEQMTVRDLIKAIAVASANDASVAMAEFVSGSEQSFVKSMNEKAKQLGMKDTVFKNCNGLDEDGHLTSAYDVALMSRELMKHEDVFEFTSIWLDYLRDGATQIVNTNKLLQSYDGITGLKTGTTSIAGCCISATAKRDDMHLIAVVLGADNTTDRFNDAAALLNYGFANYSAVSVQIPEDIVQFVDVSNGMKSTVSVKAEIDGKFLLEKGSESDITSQYKIKEDIEAPVITGMEVGRILYKCGDTVLGEYPICAAEEIEKINFKGVFLILLNAFLTM
ncbi:MAG: D-alanyl-D-alanine carboxypeptidase [Clostridia bacterium]|nr:D-alanyl-D-alanine carboxypeptidase [Clostridia bacterium]